MTMILRLELELFRSKRSQAYETYLPRADIATNVDFN